VPESGTYFRPAGLPGIEALHASARALRRHAVGMSTRRCAELVRIWPNGSDAGRGGGAGRGRGFVRLR